MGGGYVVEIKPSARRINRGASAWVGRRGSTRTFGSKDEARRWAAAIAPLGGTVRVQNAAPNDPDPVDGYLVADPSRRRARPGDTGRTTAVTFDEF